MLRRKIRVIPLLIIIFCSTVTFIAVAEGIQRVKNSRAETVGAVSRFGTTDPARQKACVAALSQYIEAAARVAVVLRSTRALGPSDFIQSEDIAHLGENYLNIGCPGGPLLASMHAIRSGDPAVVGMMR